LPVVAKLSGAGYLAAAAGGSAAAAGSTASQHQQVPLISLTYVGAVVMSLGCFAFIFAFVVFCEARDHAIDFYIRSRRYAASSRGPRHCRLPFHYDVLDLVREATKRRDERKLLKLLRQSGPAAVAAVASHQEAASTAEESSDKVEDDCVGLLSATAAGVDETRDNGMSSDSVTCRLNRSDPDVDYPESSRSSKWSVAVVGNGMLHQTSVPPTFVEQSNPQNVQIKHFEFEQLSVSRLVLGNGMLNTESVDSMSTGCPEQSAELYGVNGNCLEQGRVSDGSFSDGMIQQLTPEDVQRIANSTQKMDSDADIMSVQGVAWDGNWKSDEVVPLMSAVQNVDGVPTESIELERTSTTYVQQSQVELAPLGSASSSSSSSSVLFEVLIHPEEAVSDEPVPSTTLKTTEDVAETVGHSSLQTSETVPDSSSSSTPASPDLGDSSSPSTEGTKKGSRRSKMPCRLPSADRQTASPVVERTRRWRTPGDGRPEQDTGKRSHAGIHYPPPLPPPPTSPTIVVASARSTRIHK